MDQESRIDWQNEEKVDWMQYVRVLRRRCWWFAIPVFVVWIVAWGVSWFIPAVYRSETVILVEQQRVPEQYVVANVGEDLQQRLQSMTQQILSRTRLLRIIKDSNLASPDASGANLDAQVEKMRKDIQIELVQSPGRTELNAFKIAYLSRNPELAQKVVSQLSSLFIDENLKARQEQSEDTTEFLDSQLETARVSLAAQEEKVRDFKTRYLGELPGQLQSNVQILAGLQSRREQEMAALGQSRQQAVYLESMLNQLRSAEADVRTGRSSSSASPAVLDSEIEKLQTQLAELSSRYSDEHPDVQKVKSQLAKAQKLRQQRDAELANEIKSGATSQESPARPKSYADLQAMSPRLQLESQLKANRLEIENHQRVITDVERQIGAYQARLNTSPLREQQLADLTRDYDQSRKNYEQLLAKRNQSEMATNLEIRQQGERFRILDPANLPQKPDSPNRFKLAIMGLGAGIFFGFVLVIGSEVVDDRIQTTEELREITTAQILVEIPPLLTPQEQQTKTRNGFLQAVTLSVMGVVVVLGLAVSRYFG